MGINYFGITILLAIAAMAVYFWNKRRIVANFLLGGLILIGLSHLDFLDFAGKLGPISGAIMVVGYLGLNLTYLFYLLNKKRKWHIVYACCFSIFFLSFCLAYIDYGKYYEHKAGMLIRIFASFFPLYLLEVRNNGKNLN